LRLMNVPPDDFEGMVARAAGSAREVER
jgi:hypothetical protein